MDAKYEYDRFGPWILEINEKDGIPPLFESHIDKDATPNLRIKIPRDIERRVAHPGMNLYDYLITIDDSQIQILERQNESVGVQELDVTDIKCMEVQEDLLTGRLRLYTPKKSVNVRFNTVSTEVILKLVGLIRAKYAEKGDYKEIEALSFHPGDTMSHGFNGLWAREMSNNRHIKALLAQPEAGVALPKENLLQRIKHVVTGKKLNETLVLTNGKELIVYNRTPFFRYRNQAVYAINRLYLPIEKITGIAMDKDNLAESIVRLTLSASQYIFPLLLVEDNPALMPFVGAICEAADVELHKGRSYLESSEPH